MRWKAVLQVARKYFMDGGRFLLPPIWAVLFLQELVVRHNAPLGSALWAIVWCLPFLVMLLLFGFFMGFVTARRGR